MSLQINTFILNGVSRYSPWQKDVVCTVSYCMYCMCISYYLFSQQINMNHLMGLKICTFLF